MRVLIAEDDPVSRRILQSSLLKWGYEVEVACDGLQAWDVIQSVNAPRLAILDWMMPGMDGLSICQALRDRTEGPYIYTILLTAKSQRDDLLAGLNAGADDYIVKPFDPHELRVRLRAGKRVLDLQAQLLAERESQRLQAIRDPLTSLPNRLLFGEQLADRIFQAERAGKSIAVMFLDLDHFKVINDSLGHNIGDQLLKTVAQRISHTIRESDVVARMGGDEFTFIIGPDANAEDSIITAERVLSALTKPVVLNGNDIAITGSIGISLYPQDGNDAETLVRNADAAMYRAKESGRNACRLFAGELEETAIERISLESDLRKSLEHDQMVLHYQVRMDMQTGLATGVEALIRWRHPQLGLLPPGKFIQLAEDTGTIEPISEWVLNQACAQSKAWQDFGFRMEMAVNISSRVLHHADLVGMVVKALEATGLPPGQLCLEMTEETILKNPDRAVEVLTSLKRTGVNICIDDFGSGYSSLGDLKRLPFDAVKIDPSFVRSITSSGRDSSMAGAIVALAHSLNLKVTGEGVETLDQLEALKSTGCDAVQGYFISRPVPVDEFLHLLAEGRPPLANWVSFAA